jgi:hypothetical protein
MPMTAVSAAAEFPLSVLQGSRRSVPFSPGLGSTRRRSQRSLRVRDRVIEAIRLNPPSRFVPGSSRTRILGQWAERGGAIRLRVLERGAQVLLAETSEAALQDRGARAELIALSSRYRVVTDLGGEVAFARNHRSQLLLGGSEALAFEPERRVGLRAAPEPPARLRLEFGDPHTCLVYEALRFSPGVACCLGLHGERVRTRKMFAKFGELGSELVH